MQPNAEKEKQTRAYSIFLLIISLGFYLFFAFYDGAVICVDSPSYIEMNISREPLYPMFLAFLRFIFTGAGTDFYLTAAVFLQSVLAAVSAWSFSAFLGRKFQLHKAISLLTLLLSFAVSLLCRFAAQRGSMYSNSILTEGIAISCYLLLFRWLIDYILEPTRQKLLWCCALVFLLISTRKQMIFSLIMLMICLLIVYGQKKKLLKGLGTAFLCAAGILFCCQLLDLGYNYVLRGEVTRHSSDTRFITTIAFYTAQREDAVYIEDEEIQKLFEEIYDICEEKGYLKNAAGSGWSDRVSHFGDCYDCIQIDTMWPMINAFSKERCGEDIVALNAYADEIMNVINSSVIPHNILKILSTFADNFFSGLVTTVAQRNSILIWYSLLIYLFYIALLLYHIRAVKDKNIILLSVLTLISIVLNVGLVSLVIFCQTRYTIYNMALFYISLLLMMDKPILKRLQIYLHHPFLKH